MQSQNLKTLNDDFSSNHNPLAYVIGYIKANLNEKISSDSLSDKACMSKATFYRLFKRELGISPNDYIFAEKMNRAKELLSRPGNKIAAISYELGLSLIHI